MASTGKSLSKKHIWNIDINVISVEPPVWAGNIGGREGSLFSTCVILKRACAWGNQHECHWLHDLGAGSWGYDSWLGWVRGSWGYGSWFLNSGLMAAEELSRIGNTLGVGILVHVNMCWKPLEFKLVEFDFLVSRTVELACENTWWVSDSSSLVE